MHGVKPFGCLAAGVLPVGWTIFQDEIACRLCSRLKAFWTMFFSKGIGTTTRCVGRSARDDVAASLVKADGVHLFWTEVLILVHALIAREIEKSSATVFQAG